MTDLLAAAADSPYLLAFLVVGGFAVWAVEKLCGLDGPATRLFRAWQDRELRRLRRKATAAAERRAIERQSDDARVAELEREVDWLREQLDRTRTGRPELPPATEPIRSRHRRNSARPPVPPR